MSPLGDLFDRSVKARALAYLYASGAIVGLLSLILPHAEGVKEGPLVGLATAALAIGAVIYWRARGVTEWHLHALVVTGTLMLTLANYWFGPTALYAMMFSWAALYAFYFFDLRHALAHLALIGVSYALLLVLADHPSPATRWLLAIGTPAIAGLLISRLLTRLRAEAIKGEQRAGELRQTEARTRLVLDSAPDAFVTLDRDGIITTWNAAAERMFGWSTPEAIGRPFRSLIIAPEFRDLHDERRRELIEAKGTVTGRLFEIEAQRRDGTRFPAEATVSKVVESGDVYLPGFIRDISERRRREDEREALLREQAARAEAERVAEMVSGMQLLVDAALAHRTLGDIVADLVTRVRGVLRADTALIYLRQEDGSMKVVARAGPERDGADDPMGTADDFANRVAESREPLLLEGEDSVIGVPLMAEGDVTGVLLVRASEPRRFGSEDLGLLRLTADRVALGIDQARVYEREHRIAETLQRSLLPERLPQLPGLGVAARYLPAAAEAEVGGDWYDVIPIPGGEVGLVMGDVAGKGLAAASMVGQLRSALRAYAMEGHPPQRVLEQLNRLVWTEMGESEMATLLFLVLDPADGAVRWVNAGHLPPLLVVGDRLAHFMEGGRSVPLGVMPFPTFEEVTSQLDPGGTVVLYTDGLVERPGDHIDNGLARLAGAVRDAPADPEQLCDHMLRTLVPEGAAPDDVALLALQNVPMADRFSAEFPTEPHALASMRSLLRRWLRHAHGTDQEIAEITTACGEAATNAIEHAGSSSGIPFEVVGQLEGREIDIIVRDYGAWRAPRSGDQGRGLSLIEALMDEVEVSPTPEGTSIRMRRTLNGEAP
ncbi:MAG TPA: SpoIIE family protein phosphatase [Thermoleophilaceae bacterium]|nr:SpoIIE family protein phosphatase [Thermoleophilaceae bacterium]